MQSSALDMARDARLEKGGDTDYELYERMFVRKSMNSSKILKRHSNALDFFQAWYNFVKPHKSLRLEINQGRKRWMQRTPAMAEGLTDHIWSIRELLDFRIPVQ